METILVHPQNKRQLTILKTLFEEMNIPFSKISPKESKYNEDFEIKMKKAAADKKAGRYKAIKTADLWK